MKRLEMDYVFEQAKLHQELHPELHRELHREHRLLGLRRLHHYYNVDSHCRKPQFRTLQSLQDYRVT